MGRQAIENTESTANKDFGKISAGMKNTDLWKWSVNLPIHPRAMLKAGNYLVIAGYALTNLKFLNAENAEFAEKKLKLEISAVSANSAVKIAKDQGLLVVASSTDGTIQEKDTLQATPVWDGMAAANNRLYIATMDGSIICFGSN